MVLVLHRGSATLLFHCGHLQTIRVSQLFGVLKCLVTLINARQTFALLSTSRRPWESGQRQVCVLRRVHDTFLGDQSAYVLMHTHAAEMLFSEANFEQ